MENNDYLNNYREFFQYFDDTLDPNDQLPVKLACYRLLKSEVVGAIFNWTNQYLSEKRCPAHLISFISRIVIDKTRKRCKKQPLLCGFNPSDNAYEPLKLMHTVIEIINEVCLNYKSSLNVQNVAVSDPLPPPETVYNVVSSSALKNSRRKMEDRFIAIHDLNTIFTKQDATPSHYYAVFDGHDGEHAAAYSVNHLHQYLAESAFFTTDPQRALHDAFSKTDSMFLEKCETEKIVSGTTVVCGLLLPKENTLYVAWVGDSQAALVSQGRILPCVNPHKPERVDERRRIEQNGGEILHWGVWRVKGQLSVSRAIGDPDYKPYVTAVPEILKIPLSGKEDFLVLGSDGLWDYVPEVDVAKIVYEIVYADPAKAEYVSRELVLEAKRNGSQDNISVIVVFLKDPNKIAEGPKWTNRVVSMDTLENNTNPFAVQNKTNVADNIGDEGLLLNITDGLRKDDDIPNNDLIKMLEKSNCGRLSPEFDKDDNFGPETDVDNPDDGSISPNVNVMMKKQTETTEDDANFNPFAEIEKLELHLNEIDKNFDNMPSPVADVCQVSTNSVHNVSQLIEAVADSDSEEEEEWNYVRGELANKENLDPLQLDSEVAEEEETEDNMSQLNPNAAEFVPVSPVRTVSSPLGRLLNDEVISQSPKKPPPSEEDLNVPNPSEFEKDILQKPHEIEEVISNGHQIDMDAVNLSAMGKTDAEFHFGPNATPFTPSKLIDQSLESSTRAVYGDESAMTLGASFNASAFGQIDDEDDLDRVQKDDPMSMSFHQDRMDDSNPFDLNKIQMLPSDAEDEELAGNLDDSNPLINDTISDLVEHHPMGEDEDKVPDTPVTDLDNEDNKPLFPETTQAEETRVESPVEATRTATPQELKLQETASDMSEDERVASPEFATDKPMSPFEEKEACSPVEDKETEPKDLTIPVERLILDQTAAEREEPPKAGNLELSTICDNVDESPLRSESVTSEPSPNNDEFLGFQSEKSDPVKAKEVEEQLLDLAVPVPDLCQIPDTTFEEPEEIQAESKPIPEGDLLGGIAEVEHSAVIETVQREEIAPEPTETQGEEVTSTACDQLILEEAEKISTFESQPTPESDHKLINELEAQAPTDVSADTESVATEEVNSFLQRSLLAEVESPLSPNLSTVVVETQLESTQSPETKDDVEVLSCNDVLSVGSVTEALLLSPAQTPKPFENLTSTPTVDKAPTLITPASPLVEVGASEEEKKTPKPPVKEEEKKTPKPKVSGVAAKKAPAPRTLPGASARTSTLASKAAPKTNQTAAKTGVPKSDTSAARTATKPASTTAARPPTTARVPLSSRPKPATTASKVLTNGDAKPTPRPGVGVAKKTTEGSTSARSATSLGASRPAAPKVPLAAAKSAPLSAAAPKPRPNTLKPLPSRPVASTKPATTTRTVTSTTKTTSSAAPKTTSMLNKSPRPTATATKTASAAKVSIDKQVKETANKLTASRTTTTRTTGTTQTKTSLTSRTQVAGAKTTTSRTITSTTSRPPIKKPATDAGTKTTITKVGKPKQNGVAATVTEQILVNNSTNKEMNGIESGEVDQQFVKDNSPIDNKLILDGTAAN